MRKKVFYSIAITTLLFVFTACSSNDDDSKKVGNVSKGIIGTWAVKNMSCYDSEKLGADILTYTTNNRMEAKHYEDETGYGIYKLGCPVRCSEKQMLKSPIKLLI